MEIVIIDDSATTLAILRSLCAKVQDATTRGFSDPVEALEYLQTHPVGLVIADYSMPRLTGVEIIKQLRASPLHTLTPILMVSGSTERAVHNRAFEVGATEFVSKPVNAKELKACVLKHLGIRPPESHGASVAI
jgi:PleD family two-component response regulator